MMIAGIAGRERGVDGGGGAGAGPTSIVRVTVTAGAGGGAGFGGTGGCGGRATGARCAAATPGFAAWGSGRAAGVAVFGSGDAGADRPSLPGPGLRPSFGARFIGGPSSPAFEGVGDDEDSSSPFVLGKSFEKMLIADLEDKRLSSALIKPPRKVAVRSRLH
jgi:hypothetical protein